MILGMNMIWNFYGCSTSFDVDFSLRPFYRLNATKIGVCYRTFPLDRHRMIGIGVYNAAVQVVKTLQPVNLPGYRHVDSDLRTSALAIARTGRAPAAHDSASECSGNVNDSLFHYTSPMTYSTTGSSFYAICSFSPSDILPSVRICVTNFW